MYKFLKLKNVKTVFLALISVLFLSNCFGADGNGKLISSNPCNDRAKKIWKEVENGKLSAASDFADYLLYTPGWYFEGKSNILHTTSHAIALNIYAIESQQSRDSRLQNRIKYPINNLIRTKNISIIEIKKNNFIYKEITNDDIKNEIFDICDINNIDKKNDINKCIKTIIKYEIIPNFYEYRATMSYLLQNHTVFRCAKSPL